jgi:hypothetical protein
MLRSMRGSELVEDHMGSTGCVKVSEQAQMSLLAAFSRRWG